MNTPKSIPTYRQSAIIASCRSIWFSIAMSAIAFCPINAGAKTAEFIGEKPSAPFSEPSSWNSGVVPDSNTDILLVSNGQIDMLSEDKLTVKSIKNALPKLACRVFVGANPLEVTGDVEVNTLLVVKRIVCNGDIKILNSIKSDKLIPGLTLQLNPKSISDEPKLAARNLLLNENPLITIQVEERNALEVFEVLKKPLVEVNGIEASSGLKILLRTYPPLDYPISIPAGEYPLILVKNSSKPDINSMVFSNDFVSGTNGNLEWRGDVLYLIVK